MSRTVPMLRNISPPGRTDGVRAIARLADDARPGTTPPVDTGVGASVTRVHDPVAHRGRRRHRPAGVAATTGPPRADEQLHAHTDPGRITDRQDIALRARPPAVGSVAPTVEPTVGIEERGDDTVRRTPSRRSPRAPRPDRPLDARTGRRTGRVVRAVGLAVLALVLAGCSGPQSFIDPQGPFAQAPDDLFKGVLIVAAVVFVFVQGLIIYTVVRYRRRDGDDSLPKQVHGNTRLEIVWTVIPALILAGIAVPTVQQVFALAEEPEGALTVEVIGHRWWWEYRYPDSGVITANELVIPVDRPIRLEMRAEEAGSEDRGVLHSYWVPALAGKQDVFPGRITTLNMEADTTGRFLGQCAEYCGLSHANMRNRAVVLEPDEFDEWVAQQQAPSEVAAAFAELGPEALDAGEIPAGIDEQVGNGYYVYQNNCVACHAQITSAPVASAEDFEARTGPNLTHLLSRREFAGAIFDLYEREDPDDPNSPFTDQVDVEQLTAWVRNAPSLKAMRPADGVGMNSFESLSEEDLDAVIAYLLTMGPPPPGN